jgi:HPt (histidine-containing phosphotransfer) domain-containing protein
MAQGILYESPAALDLDDLLARCLGNIEFAARILAMFQTRFGEDLEALERHLVEGDADSVLRLAHRLKGSSANASAPGLQVLTAEIEQLARDRDLGSVHGRLPDLRQEWCRFQHSAAAAHGETVSNSRAVEASEPCPERESA